MSCDRTKAKHSVEVCLSTLGDLLSVCGDGCTGGTERVYKEWVGLRMDTLMSDWL